MSASGETKSGSSADAPDRIVKAEWTRAELWKRYGSWVITAVNLTCFFLLWEAVVSMGFINQLFLPKASNMFAALWQGLTTSAPPGASVSGSIRDHLFFTLRNLGIGLVIAIVLGVPAGLLMGGNKNVETILSPYIWALASLPRVALVPLFILFLGFTMTMQVTIVVLSAIFPIIINAWAGVKTTDKSLLAAARVFGASRWELYAKVVLPFTLPFIMAGVQQGIGRGLVGVVIAEIFGGSSGLDYLIKRAADTFNSSLMYSTLLVLVVVSVGLVQTTRWLEARIAPWRRIDSL